MSYVLRFNPTYWEEQGKGVWGDFLVLMCNQVKNPGANSSTIYWSLGREFNYTQPNPVAVGPITLTIDGKTVYQLDRKEPGKTDGWPCDALTSGAMGSFEVEHNEDGTKSIPVSLSCAAVNTTVETITDTFVLSTIKKVSTISQNPTEIGDTAVLTIYADGMEYTHDVTYQFGSQKGTILSGVRGGTYTWTFPNSFYDEFSESEVSKTGTLTCITYLGAQENGSSTTEFVVTINKGMPPTITVSLQDVDATVYALTHDRNKMIPGFSDIQYTMEAEPHNGASIASVRAANGAIVKDTATGTFTNPSSYSFVFNATDSRGLTTRKSVVLDGVFDADVGSYYFKPSVNISEIDFGTDGNLAFKLSGSWWNGNFGYQENTFIVYKRYKLVGGTWSAWTNTNAGASSHTYSVNTSFSGLDYRSRYVIQAKIVDKLQSIESAEVIVNVNPVFDWSEKDFNFNVPVNFSNGVSGIKAEDVEGAGLRYGTCNTGASTTAKVVVCEGYPALVTGSNIRVKFSYGNTATSPTLNVNNTGARPIVGYGSTADMAYKWYDGEVKDFVYDGSNWIMVSGGIATTENYGIVKLTNSPGSNQSMAITPYGVQQATSNITSSISSLTSQVQTNATTSQYGRTILTSTVGVYPTESEESKAVTPKGVATAIKNAMATAGTWGTWTPTLEFGSINVTYHVQKGWYQQIQDVVTVGFVVVVTVPSYSVSAGIRPTIRASWLPLPWQSNTYSLSAYGGGYCHSSTSFSTAPSVSTWGVYNSDGVVRFKPVGTDENGQFYFPYSNPSSFILYCGATICYPMS